VARTAQLARIFRFGEEASCASGPSITLRPVGRYESTSTPYCPASESILITYILAPLHSPPKKPKDTLNLLLAPMSDATSSLSAGCVPFTSPTNMPWVRSTPPTELALSIQDFVSVDSVPI
jgi:hypothetical protein